MQSLLMPARCEKVPRPARAPDLRPSTSSERSLTTGASSASEGPGYRSPRNVAQILAKLLGKGK